MDARGRMGIVILTMSYDRRDFLKTLTLGGIALFTPDWFGSVKDRRPRQPEFRLPAYPGDPIPENHDLINAVWNTGTGYILYLNGTPYGEPPKITLREKLSLPNCGSAQPNRSRLPVPSGIMVTVAA